MCEGRLSKSESATMLELLQRGALYHCRRNRFDLRARARKLDERENIVALITPHLNS